MTRVALVVAALVAGVAGCITNPVTGRSELSLMSVEQERAAGAQGAREVAQQIGLVDDPELTAYVDAVGQRLAGLSPRKDVTYQFAVADMPEPNAFALPGGWIYVSRGLLVVTNSEAELANVIGHEIGHVAARHSAQRQTQSMLVGIGTMLGALGAAAVGVDPGAVAQLGQVAGAGLIASYGRDQERQSDEIGQQLAAGSGWDPAAMSDFMRTLEREELLQTGQKRLPSFFDSHPMTGERAAKTAERARTLSVAPVAPIAPSQADFLRRLDGLLVGPDPAEGVFDGTRFRHPGLGFALEFPRGWKTVNQKQSVGGQSPAGDALVMLEVQGAPGSPVDAARAFVQQNRLQVEESGAVEVGGYRGYRVIAAVQSQQGPLGLDLTWIAHPEVMLRMTGMSPAARFSSNAASFERVAGSFRPLSRAEREGIEELRLTAVAAREGESLAALSQRSGNGWSTEETAAANGLPVEARLRAGQLVKIAKRVPYRP